MTHLAFWQARLRGDGAVPPSRPAGAAMAKAGLGGVIAIALVGLIALWSGQPWVLGSFGASCVMLFGYPDLPFSQPRHVLGGHLLSSFIGLVCLTLLGPSWWAMALSAGLAIVAMIALRVPHPPAGSNPVIVFLGHPGWGFLLYPTLAGALVLLLVVLIYNNLTRETAYPRYW